MPTGAELDLRIRNRATRTAVLSAAIGAAVVFVFLAFVFPAPDPKPGGSAIWVNIAAALVYLAASIGFGVRHGRRIGAIRHAWLREEREPTEREVRDVLRLPLRTLGIQATFWGAAAVLFGLLNLAYSAQLAEHVAITVLLGGVTTSAIAYLLEERWMRPVAALALRAHTPAEPVTAGILTRITSAWVLATGVPLVGIGLVALSQIVEGGISAGALARSVLFLSVIALLAGAAAIRIAGRGVAEPLAEVRGALGRVERGDIDTEVPVYDGSEVGLLQAGFNRMAAGLREREQLRDLFGRHVGEDVAREALAGGVALGGEEREVAVLFVDVIGSTALAAKQEPSAVVARLNEFFAAVVETVDAHHGWVNKFEGDAALAIFGAPTHDADAAGHALAAARVLRGRLDAEELLPAAIGVSAGRVVAGNVGATERFEYTVIGDPVNEAARLTDLAKTKDARVLASSAAVQRANPEEAARWREDGEAILRGRDEPTRLAAPA